MESGETFKHTSDFYTQGIITKDKIKFLFNTTVCSMCHLRKSFLVLFEKMCILFLRQTQKYTKTQ